MVQDKLIFPEWIGEFGWELMSWQAKCRYTAKEMGLPKERVIVRSFEGMAPLYEDFATFESHSLPKRAISWKPKQYRIKGSWRKFGNSTYPYRYVFHARGDPHKSAKNCGLDFWNHLGRLLPSYCVSIGSRVDIHIPGTLDARGIPLQELMDLLGSCKKVIGQSSGPMHLAALCGAPLVVWADNRTYFSETLEKRYKETWNPFQVPVDYIYTGLDWKPTITEVMHFL